MSRFITFTLLMMFVHSCSQKDELKLPVIEKSPSGNIKAGLTLNSEGTPVYWIKLNDQMVIDSGSMGFRIQGMDDMISGFTLNSVSFDSLNEIWEMPWGEDRKVVNHYREFFVQLVRKDKVPSQMNIRFRIFDDGVGFRYEFPEQAGIDTILIEEEETFFRMTGDHLCWWAPGDWDIYEHLYNTTRISEINALSKRNHPNLAQTYIPVNAVSTPFTMKTGNEVYMSIHEAALTDYADMTLLVDNASLSLKSNLAGSDNRDYKVSEKIPFVTPWRVILISNDAPGLIRSKVILNLNEPDRLGDITWFKPMKYAGIWWEMHLGKSGWDYAGGKHGATTERAKEIIDFAAANGIGGVLVEGWNTGWEDWAKSENREGIFDFVTPYPDYDLKEVVSYARSKGVEIIMHHETSSAVLTYEKQMDTAFALMKELGIHLVKTGYVGKISPTGEYHHGQWMVNHYRRVIEKAAEYEIAVDIHEPIKATGIRRTYPNVISREGLRGQEFNAWSTDGGNPPEHLSIVAFTRMLAGPVDYTPGIFNLKLKPYKENNQVNTTLSHQLALYVVIYSPVQMVPDLPEYYRDQPAFQFIRDVGVDWEESVVINGEPGDFVTIARKEKTTGNWFVGGITDEEQRIFKIWFSFLDPETKYKATLYRDGENAHWDKNPTHIEIESFEAGINGSVQVRCAPGGGFALSLIKE